MPTINRADASINYEHWLPSLGGGQATVTLINGHTRTLADFKMMGRALTEAGFGVVAIDNRGSGKTTAGLDFSIDDMVDDVIGVWDESEIERSHVLGISMGGLIAQVLACRYPERLDKLVLVSTSPSLEYLKGNDQSWVTDLKGIEVKMASYFTPDFIARNRLLFDSMVKQTAKAVAEGDFLPRAEAQRRAVSAFQAQHIEGIRAETLVIHGDLDVTVDFEGGRELAQRIPRATLKVVQDTGHLLLAERPKVLYEAVLEFLKA